MMRDWRVLAAVAVVLAVYAVLLGAMPKGAFWSPDEGAKFLQLHTLHWRGGLVYEIPYGGAALDPEFAFYPTRCRHEDLYPVRLADGGTKLHWPIWFSLVTRPPAALFGLTGLYLVPLLSGWLVALLSGRLARLFDPRLAPLTILAVGLATPVLFFSLTHWEHTLAALFGILALACVAVDPPSHRRSRWLALPLLLAAVALRLDLLPLAFAIAAAWLIARQRSTAAPALRWQPVALALALGGVGAIVLLATIELPERHRWLLRTLPEYLTGDVAKLRYLPGVLTAVFIDAPGNRAPALVPLMRGVGLAAFAAAAAAPFIAIRAGAALALAALFAVLNFSLYVGLLPQPYISLHGFLVAAPFVIVAAYALPAAWRSRRFDLLVLTATVWLYALLAFAMIFTFAVQPDGEYLTGLEWGNRYLLTLYPIAAVVALGSLVTYRPSLPAGWARTGFTVMVAALLLASVQIQARGVWMLFESRRLVASWEAALRGPDPVITDIWWLPAAVAPLFAAQPIHCVKQPSELAEWFPGALAHDVATFTFASFHPVQPERFAAPGFVVTEEREEIVSGLHLTRLRLSRRAAPEATDGSG